MKKASASITVGRDTSARDEDRGRPNIKVAMEEYSRILASTESTSFFDMAKPPTGMEYLWARETVYSEPDEGRIPSLYIHKFTGVPFSRHANLYSDYMRYRQQSPDDSIKIRGQMLLERPKVFGDMQRAYINKQNILAQQAAIRNVQYAGDHLTTPIMRNKTSMMQARVTADSSQEAAQDLDW